MAALTGRLSDRKGRNGLKDGVAFFVGVKNMALRRLWHRQDGAGNFVEFMQTDGLMDDQKLLMYQGKAQEAASVAVTEIPLTEEVRVKLEENFKGPDDPRLPGDVAKMPIGKREDFVDEFNFYYWFYDKDSDPDYDEDKSYAINSVNYALKKAYAYATRTRKLPAGDVSTETTDTEASQGSEPKSGIPESSLESMTTASGAIAHRVRESIVGVVVPGSLKESEVDGEADADVVIIRAGWSLNDNYYGDQALEGVASAVNESKPGFMNHGPTFSRDPRDWAIMLHSAEVVDDEVHAKMHIFRYPDGDFLKERVEKAPHLFGGSIDAFVLREEGTADGRDGLIVTEVVLLNCWDIVMFPAAGGAIVGTNESQVGSPNAKQTGEVEKMNLETLKEKHPALYELVVQQAKADAIAEAKALQDKLEVAEASNRELQAELDGIKSAEEKRQKGAKFDKDLNAILADAFEDGEVSAEFKALLAEEGPDNMPRIKKMVAERRKVLDSVSTEAAENQESNSGDEESAVASDEDELARFRSARKTA